MRINKMPQYVFLLTLFLMTAHSVFGQNAYESNLIIRGNVQNIRRLPNDPHYVAFEVNLNLEFVNTGGQPVIFLQPNDNTEAEIFWLGTISLSLSETQAKQYGSNSYIWVSTALPSVDTSPVFRQMANRLNQPLPPPDLTRILQPKETWVWKTKIPLRFYAKTSSCCSSQDLGWEVIGKIGTPLWMRLNYVIWSNNLLRADNGLLKRLRSRWKRFGILNAEASLTTEPIEIKLNEMNAR
jgi:hypothetical protein